jgi:hypothetical protein
MAEPESDYSWIFGLVIVFFMFLLPILKKVADALTGKKQPPLHRPGAPGQEPEKRGAVGEMLDEIEGYFRKSRAGPQLKQEAPPAVGAGKKEYSPYDRQYRERKREIEERRRHRGERRERRRLSAVGRPEEVQPERPAVGAGFEKFPDRPLTGKRPEGLSVVEKSHLVPAVGEKAEGLGTLRETMGRSRLTSLAREERAEVREESFFEVLGELPEMARMVVLSEVLSPPKSLQ